MSEGAHRAIKTLLIRFVSCVLVSQLNLSNHIAKAEDEKKLSPAECLSILLPQLKYSHNVDEIEKIIRPQWNPKLFTSPEKHDPNHFIYLVRAMRSGENADELFTGLVSASVIGNNAAKGEKLTATIGKQDWAAIIDVPEDRIVVAVPRDTGRMARSGDGRYPISSPLLDLSERYGMYTPQAMISESIEYAKSAAQSALTAKSGYDMNYRHIAENPYNEVLFRGSWDVKIRGIAFFPKNLKYSNYLDSWEYKYAKSIADKRRVPLVIIE